MSMLNVNMFYVDQNELAVKSGSTTAHFIDSQTGYEMLNIIHETEEGKQESVRVERALAFESLDEAERKLAEVKPVIEEARKLNDEINSKFKELREQVIGKPFAQQ